MILTAKLIKASCICLLLLICSLVNAATIIVDSRCTVNDALKASQNDISVGACQAGSGVDTIILPANGNYVIPVQKKSSHGYYQDGDGTTSVRSTVITRG